MKTTFLDTEFTRLPTDDGAAPTLISIGMVIEGEGRAFYAELSDGWQVEDCSDFVRSQVLPKLQKGDALMDVRTLAQSLSRWIASVGKDIEILASSPHDLFFLEGLLLCSPEDRPANLARTRVFRLRDFSFARWIVAVLAQRRYFAQGGRRHHALDDAIALRESWNAGRRFLTDIR